MRRPSRKTIIVTATLIAVVATGVFAWRAGTLWAAEFRAAAGQGKSLAEKGATNLAAGDAEAAASYFTDAADRFEEAQSMLGQGWAGRAARALPWAGRQYAAAWSMTEIGLQGSRGGMALSALLSSEGGEVRSPASGGKRMPGLLSKNRQHIDSTLESFSLAAQEYATLDEEGLIAPLREQIGSLKAVVAQRIPFLERVPALLSLVDRVLADERRMIVIAQNNTELRPTGGFFGTYGVIRVGPQGTELETYRNVYRLPRPPREVTTPSRSVTGERFAFRDSNWWVDFPTSAERMLTLWDEAEQPAAEGIIAIDLVAMSRLFGVLGSLELRDHGETFTEDNLIERLSYLVQVEGGGKPEKKEVVIALAKELERRLTDASLEELAGAARVLAEAADEKHLQLYFTDPAAQKAAESLGWAGAVDAPPGTTDLLAVSNAMTLAAKTNFAMSKQIDYEVALLPDGSADTRLELRYENSGPLAVPESGVFRSYLRVYRTPGTEALPAAESTSAIETDAMGLPMVARTVRVPRDKSHTEIVLTRVPHAWRPVSGDSNRADYRLYLVRQADLQDVPTAVRVAAPEGWVVSAAAAHFVASGRGVEVMTDERSARLEIPLSGDLLFDIQLARRPSGSQP